MRDKKIRIQMDMTPKAASRLDELGKQLDVASRAEVVRRSLGMLEWVLHKMNTGSTIYLENEKNGDRCQVVIPELVQMK